MGDLQQVDADSVFVVVNKNYRVSRNIRANWYFQKLHSTFTLSCTDNQPLLCNSSAESASSEDEEAKKKEIHQTTSRIQSKDFEIIAATPQVDSYDVEYKITEKTDVRFLSLFYRFVFIIDMSPSMFDIAVSGKTLANIAIDALEKSLRKISHSSILPGTKFAYFPKIIITILAHSIDKACILLQGWEVNYSEIPEYIQLIRQSTDRFETELYQSAQIGFKEHLPASEGILLNMIRHGVLALSTLYPDNSTAGIIIISDCVHSMADMIQLDRTLGMLRTRAIACSFVKVGKSRYEEPFEYFGHIDYADMCRFIASASFGSFILMNDTHKDQSNAFDFNTVNGILLARSFNKSLISIHDTYHLGSPIIILEYFKKSVNAPLMSVLSVRLREGYIVKNFHIMTNANIQHIIVDLILIWKPGVLFHYSMTSAWPLDVHNETDILVKIEGNYEFIHEVTCIRKSLVNSDYRMKLIHRFRFHFQQLEQTDMFLVHLHSFNINSLYYQIPESHKNGLKAVFILADDLGIVVSDKAIEQFAAYWKPIVQLDISNCQKWLHTHSINVILEHDSPIPPNINLSEPPNSKLSNIVCRQGLVQLSSLLQQSCSFILLENHSYVKFIYDEDKIDDLVPLFFYLIRLELKMPEVRIKLAFLAGTPGELRYSICQDLKQKLTDLTFPARGRQADPKSRHKSGHFVKNSSTHLPPLQRTWSETQCCNIIESAIDRLLVSFLPRTSLNFKTLDLYTSSENLSLPMRLLVHQLQHDRSVWIVQQPPSFRLERLTISKMFNSLINIRLQEGFHFAYCKDGFVNMVQEVHFETESGTPSPALVQYVLYPLSQKPRQDSDCSDVGMDSESDDLNVMNGIQVVSEVWISPVLGKVVNPQEEISHWNGAKATDIHNLIFEYDLDCLTTYTTFERLKRISISFGMSTTKRLNSNKNVKIVAPNLNLLLCKSPQLLLLFKFYEYEDSDDNTEFCNDKLMTLLFKELLVSRYAEYELSISDVSEFISQLYHRFDKTPTAEAKENLTMRCFIWIEKDSNSVIVLVTPSNYSNCRSDIIKDLLSNHTNETVLPIFLYVFSRGYLSFLLEDRWTYQKPCDEVLNLSSCNLPISDNLMLDNFTSCGKKNPKLTDELKEMQTLFIKHARSVNSHFSKSFVTGIYECIRENKSLCKRDIEMTINDLCEELAPLEINATEFMQTVCGHCFQPLQRLKYNWLLEGENPLLTCMNDSDHDLCKIQVNSLRECECEVQAGFHDRVKRRINQFISKYFKKVHDLNEYFIYSPEEREMRNIDQQQQFMRSRNASDVNNSDAEQQNQFQYYRQCSKDDHDDLGLISFEDDELEDIDNEEDATNNHLPFFLHITCSVTYKDKREFVSLKEVPTCLEALAPTILKVVALSEGLFDSASGDDYMPKSAYIDLRDLKFTFDFNPLTYIDAENDPLNSADDEGKASSSTSNLVNNFEDHDDCISGTANTETLLHSGRSTPSDGSNNNSVTRTSRTQGGYRSCKVLSRQQRSILFKCRDELLWTLDDEIVCALKYVPPVVESSIETVVKHIEDVVTHNLDPEMCVGIHREQLELEFVYGPEKSRFNFIERFEKMSMNHSQCKLKKTGDYYYFIREPSSRVEWEPLGTNGSDCELFAPHNDWDNNKLPDFDNSCVIRNVLTKFRQSDISDAGNKLGLHRCSSESEIPTRDQFLAPPYYAKRNSGCDQMLSNIETIPHRSPSFQAISTFRSSSPVQSVLLGNKIEPPGIDDDFVTPIDSSEIVMKCKEGRATLPQIVDSSLPDTSVIAPSKRFSNSSGSKRASVISDLANSNLAQDTSTPRRHRSGESSSIAFFTRSRTPQPGDCLSRTSSRGYEGDNSSGGEYGDLLSDFNEESMLGSTSDMPPYWLLMKMCDSNFYIYFHHTDSHTARETSSGNEELVKIDTIGEEDDCTMNYLNSEDCAYCKIFSKVVRDIRVIVKTVNQSMLLQNMSESRLCSSLLVPEDESDMQWSFTQNRRCNNNDVHYEDDEDRPSKLYDEMKFDPGTFACPVKKRMYFRLHHRLKTHSEQGRKAIPTIRSVLENITITNRKNMFFVVDTNGSQGIFYITLFEKSILLKDLGGLAEENGCLEDYGVSSIMEQINQSGSGVEDFSPLKDTNSSGSLTAMENSVDLLEVLVHGIEHPSEDINLSIWSKMGQKLDLVVLKHLSDNLSRNPMTRLNKEDVDFLQSEDHSHLPKPPKVTFYVSLPPIATDNILAFTWFCKQNMLLNFISPKFKNNVSCSKFGLSCDTPGEIFLYNCNALPGISKNGIATIVAQLIAVKEEEPIMILGFGSPLYMNADNLNNSRFSEMTEVTQFKLDSSDPINLSSSTSSVNFPCMMRFQIWERGDANLPYLVQRIESYVQQSVKDVLMEYTLLTMPVSEMPSHHETIVQCVDSPLTLPTITTRLIDSPSNEAGREDIELVALNSPSVAANNLLSPNTSGNHVRPNSSPLINLNATSSSAIISHESARLSACQPLVRPTATHPCNTPTLTSSEQVHQCHSMHYESGVKGNLHPFYSDVMLSWFRESCANKDMPLYTKKEYSLQFNLNVHYLIGDLLKMMQDQQIIDFNVFHQLTNSAENGSGGSETWIPYCADVEAEDENVGKLNPGLKRNFILIGRNYDQWCHFVNNRRQLQTQSMTQINFESQGHGNNVTFSLHSPKQSSNVSGSNTSLPSVGAQRTAPNIDSRRIRTNQRQPPFEGSNASLATANETVPNLVQYTLNSSHRGQCLNHYPNTMNLALSSASNSSFSSGNLLPEFCRVSKHLNTDAVVARQIFAIIHIEEQTITTYCYNWTKDAMENLDKLMNNLTKRQNLRFRMLRGIVKQKLGLFHTLMSKSWNYPEQLIKECCLSPSPQIENKQTRKSSASQSTAPRQAIWGIFKNVYNVPMMERKSSNDLIYHHAHQLLKTHEQENKRSKELYQLSTPISMWQTQSKVAIKTAFSDSPREQLQSYNVLKRSCRLLHTVTTPLLFSQDLRNQLRFSMTRRGLTKPIHDPPGSSNIDDSNNDHGNRLVTRRTSLSDGKLTKIRHNSGSKTQKSRSSSIDTNKNSSRTQSEAPKNRVGFLPPGGADTNLNENSSTNAACNLPTSKNENFRNDSESSSSSFGNNFSSQHHRVMSDEEWMPDVTRYLIDQYAMHLHDMGFVLIPPPVTNPAHPRGIYAVFRKCIQNNSGIIFLEVFMRGGFFCVRLAVIEAGRYNNRNPSTRSFFKQNLNFVREACRMFDLIHVNSFMHDFHLNTIENHLASRTSMFKRRYHVVNFLEDFVRFTPRPPCYVRNHAYVTHFCVSRGNISQEILFKYLHERDKTYGLKVFRMSSYNALRDVVYDFCLFDQFNSNELMLMDEFGRPLSPYHHTIPIKSLDNHGSDCYKTSFVLVKDCKLLEEDVLQFKFFIILTNLNHQRPLPKLEKLSLELPQTYPAIRPCLLPTSDSDLSISELQRQLDLIEETTDKLPDELSLYKLPHNHDSQILAKQNCGCLDLEDGALSIEQSANLVNYMGEAVVHQKVIMQVLKKQIRNLKNRLIRLVTKAVEDCHKDMLWQRLFSTPNFMSSSGAGQGPDAVLSPSDFQQLFESAGRVDLSLLDNRLEVALDLVLPYFDQLIQSAKSRSHNFPANFSVSSSPRAPSSPKQPVPGKLISFLSSTFHCERKKLTSLVFVLPDYEDGFILITKQVVNAPVSDSLSADSSSTSSCNIQEVCKLFAIFRESSEMSNNEIYEKFLNSPLVSLITDVIELCCYTVWKQLL